MRLALAQLNTTIGDLHGNAARILASYQRAVAAGATLMLTPELALTGYPPRDLLAKRRFVQDNLRILAELAPQIGETAVLVGYVDVNPHRPGRDYLNAAALLHRGQIVARRYKTLLPTYDVFDEDRYFQPAESSTVVDLAGEKLAITICEDIRNTQGYWPNRLYRRDPVEELVATGRPSILLNISASPFHLGKAALRQDVLRAVALKHRVPLVYCNLVGGNDELVFDGQSLVVDASGNILAQGAAFQEDLLIVDLETAQPVPVPAVAPVTAVHDALVLGLRDYVSKCGFKSVVLGLSGGIDSAVTACLAVSALGPENVMGISLPSQFSSAGSLDDAKQLADNLGIRYEVLPIRTAFETLRGSCQELFHGLPEDTTEENMQARIRGTILMAISNKFGSPITIRLGEMSNSTG